MLGGHLGAEPSGTSQGATLTEVNAEAFHSLRLATRSRPGPPPRRQLGWPLATIMLSIGIVVFTTTYSRADLASALVAAVGTIALLAAAWYPLNAAFIARGRSRVRTLFNKFGDTGEDVFAIRSTATFDQFPPRQSGLLEDYIRPWNGYQVAVLNDIGIELRQGPRRDQSAGARLRYSRIDSISKGTAAFGNFTERAILIAGTEKHARYELGIVPIRPTSLTLAPVDEAEFERIASEIAARVAAAHGAAS